MIKRTFVFGVFAALLAPLAQAQVNPEYGDVNDAIEMIRDMV